MIKEPKYLIKFANAQNDNGTVWYTIDVPDHWSRSTSPKKKITGPSRKGSATWGIYISTAKKPSSKTNCLSSPPGNSSAPPKNPSSRRGKNNWKTTTTPFSKQSPSMNSQNSSSSSILTNPKSLSASLPPNLPKWITALQNFRNPTNK